MKKIFIYFLGLAPFISKGQISISNISLRDTTKNELYWGCENIIRIKGLTKSNDNFVVKTSIGKIEEKSGDKYYYGRDPNVKNEMKTDTIKIFKKGKVVYSTIFEMKAIPYDKFYFQFGGKKDSVLSVNEILLTPFLKFTTPSSNYKDYKKIDYPTVKKFDLTILSGSQKENTYSITVFGGVLNEEHKREIRKLQEGDKIVLHDIVIESKLFSSPKTYDKKIEINIK